MNSSNMANPATRSTPHVLIFPLPLQGPVNCMLKLAEILCLNTIRVTFLNTHRIQRRLSDCTATEIYFRRYPNFAFRTVPDGLPDGGPQTHDQFSELLESIESVAAPALQEMLASGGCGPPSGSPVTCIIADAIFSFTTRIAESVQLPLLYFDTISPAAVSIYLCLPKLIEAGELPFIDDNLDEIIINATGMEGILRRRDLPGFFRSKDLNNPDLKLVLKEDEQIPLSQGLILNTFEDLDGPILSQIRKFCPNIYAVGPLHAHLKARLALESDQEVWPINSSSIWEEDTTCISWLDAQPFKSVMYVSIGSLAVMTKDQLLEIWYGLVNSGSRFLWVRRPGSVVGPDLEPDEIPMELAVGTRERGFIVSWAPQEEVLAHPATGGFLTHSGWNSTLESIVEGKPMICWPSHADQQVVSRYVGEVWRIGLDMKDTCDRVIIEKMIRELMDMRYDEFLNRTEEMAKLAKLSVTRGGSSFADLDRLIDDIKTMKISGDEKFDTS